MARSKFKDEHTFEKRKAEAERIRQKYTDRIPVICEKVEKSDIATIDKKKIPGACGSHGRTVRIRHSQENQVVPGQSHFYLCRWSSTSHRCPYELHLRGTQR